jgi:ribonuclease P protein component
MLAKKNRVPRTRFQKITQYRGRVFHTQHCSICVYQKTSRSNKAVAIVVSKKVEKRAVYRNKIRRRLYTLMQVAGKESQTYIIFCKKNIDRISYATLMQEIQNALSQDVEKNTQ